MGYRSEVLMAIAGEPDKLTAFIAMLRLKHSETALAFANNEFDYGRFGELRVLVLNAPDTKWYPIYEDVQSFEAVWNAAEQYQEEFELVGRFLRIGENDGDTENRYFGDDDTASDLARLTRSIDSAITYDPAPSPVPPHPQALPGA